MLKTFRQSFWQLSMRKRKVFSEEIEKLKKDLEAIGSMDIRFYKSEFSRWSRENEIIHSEPSTAFESNHADILLEDTIIIQLLGRYSVLFGYLYEERIPENFQGRIEHILLENGYKIGNKEDFQRHRRSFQILIILDFLLAFLWLSKFMVLRVGFYFKLKDEVPRELLKHFYPDPSFFDIIMGLLWLIIGLIWVHQYKKTSFNR